MGWYNCGRGDQPTITWWIYYRQKKTSEKQEQIIERIRYLEENHDSILKSIEAILNQLLVLEKKLII